MTNANSVLEPGSGFRFVSLAAPVTLPADFMGRMAAGGYGSAELNGNAGGSAFVTGNDGGGLITFVGPSHYAGGFEYPNNADSNALQYGGPSFAFEAVPEPTGAALAAVGLAGMCARRRRRGRA